MGAGRPKLVIDPDLVEELAGIGCTVKEMASVLGCSHDTLERNFAYRIEKGKEHAKVSLRRMQWKAAESGSTGMLIWLGKQLLGQGDRILDPSKPPEVDFGTLPIPNFNKVNGKVN